MKGCKVVVIGGGPAGVLTAAQFAKRGANVTVYERRSLKRQDAPERGWTIALGDLAAYAIEDAGLSADFGAAGRTEGFVAIAGVNEPRYIGGFAQGTPGESSSAATNSLTRAWIIKHLRKECAEKYPKLVTFQDGYSLIGGKLNAGEAILSQVPSSSESDEGGDTVEGGNNQEIERELKVTADIIVAADGAGSKARSLLQQLDDDLEVERDFLSVTTMSFLLPNKKPDPTTYANLATPSGLPFQAVPKNWNKKVKGGFSVFGMPAKDSNPELVFLIVSCRAGGADLTASLTASLKWWAEKHTVDDVMKTLKAAFPRVPTAWLQCCAVACCDEDRRLQQSSFVHCSKLGVGRCVLVGDAAHSVSPNLGYGCTAGLADAVHLASLATGMFALGACKRRDDTPDGLSPKFVNFAEEWTHERLDDAHAYTRLSKSVSDLSLYKYHKNKLLVLKALPLAVPHFLGRMNFPGKSIIAPSPEATRAMAAGGMKPRDVIEAYESSATKLGFLLLLVLSVAIGFGLKGFGYVSANLPEL